MATTARSSCGCWNTACGSDLTFACTRSRASASRPTGTATPPGRQRRPDGALAEQEIPVYLLIDRDNSTLALHADPVNGRYHTQTFFFGDTVRIPEPVNVTLDDTDILRNHVR
ncbi:hypothetical protein [Streptomyces sp. NBC_00091]|uniref:hypothetical protein n=1 Tax=Streptomyces sp. NBC_00091 TaxID=2975648 RepID=UPI00225B0845|nr:hypothetical protein [Streptomyces sp. NBC_00091]MCX5380404.1 hypothetical protein [Streptomyces sp. NBC_00091]